MMHQMRIFAVLCMTLALRCEPATKAEPVLGKYVDDALAGAVPDHEFSGAVLVARNGIPLVRKAYGFADWIAKSPNTPETRFMIFSSTKQLTAAAVLRWVDKGKLALEDPVGKHVDHWPAEWASVKIHHLLSHTSGIEVDTLAFWLFHFYPEYWPEPGETPPPYERKPLLSEPGSTFQYSNVGFTVLSMVVKKMSGKTFAESMQDEVFGPLKMNRTGLEGNPGLGERARGHAFDKLEYLEQRTIDIEGAGDVVTTLDDLLKWDEALYSENYLSSTSLKAMFTPYSKGSMGELGYGWIVETTADGKNRYFHNGNGSGFRSYVFRRPDLHLYVAVLVNREYPALLPQMRAFEEKVENYLYSKQ